ncbi:MAG: hypothetical protein AAGG75_04225 [Bacteroidota bacterium]
MSDQTLIKNYYTFIDTSSLMHPGAEEAFLKDKVDFLKQNKVLIPLKVKEEILRLIEKDDTKRTQWAKKALHIFNALQASRRIKVGEYKDAQETFVDNILISLFTENRLKYNLCLITQDKQLATEILQLSKSKAVKRQKNIVVLQVQKDGSLRDFATLPVKKKPGEKVPVPKIPKKSAEKKDPFKKARLPVSHKDVQRTTVRLVPKEGSSVYLATRENPIQLTKQISKGGEGCIYETNYSKYICKIFHDKSRTNMKEDKLKLMTSRLNKRGICWPTSLVYNTHAEFVGFAMEIRARGVELKQLFIKPVFQSLFPEWKRLDLVDISIKILHKIRILHEQNVLVGDINPRNILITKARETFFVDTDSYQVEGYPCTVGLANYTAPEIQNKDFKSFLRTVKHENFAIATLLFMILVPGKTPYSHQGGESLAKNIKKRHFPYPLGEISGKNVPKGPWRFIWSNLSYKMKEAFFNVFTKGERIGVLEWIDLLKKYRVYLRHNPVSNEIYHYRYKEVKYQDGQPIVNSKKK